MQPAVQSRPMGGFNQGLGQFNDEQLEENAFQSAMQQKATNQQSAQAGTGTGTAGNVTPLAGQTPTPGAQPPAAPTPPRELGTMAEELVTRPAQDVWQGIKSIFDLNHILGVKAGDDDPQSLAKKKQMVQRFNKLTQEDQQRVMQTYRQREKEKQEQLKQEQMKKQQEQQQKSQSLAMPSSPKKGPVGPGASKKQTATAQLEHDRKTMSNPKGAN